MIRGSLEREERKIMLGLKESWDREDWDMIRDSLEREEMKIMLGFKEPLDMDNPR